MFASPSSGGFHQPKVLWTMVWNWKGEKFCIGQWVPTPALWTMVLEKRKKECLKLCPNFPPFCTPFSSYKSGPYKRTQTAAHRRVLRRRRSTLGIKRVSRVLRIVYCGSCTADRVLRWRYLQIYVTERSLMDVRLRRGLFQWWNIALNVDHRHFRSRTDVIV